MLGIVIIPQTIKAQDTPRESRISLLTASPGEDVYSVFGHTAIRVKGRDSSKDVIYNFGTFSFDQPNFLGNFLRGRLLYSLSVSSYDRFLRVYHNERRSIYEQTLNLTEEEEGAVIRALAENYKKENREYLYEFFFDNCSTRLRDLIDQKYEGKFAWKEQQPRYTFRELLHQYTDSNAWLTFGIDLLVGVRTDEKATQQEEMFLPDYLYWHLNDATLTSGQPAVTKDYTVLDFSMEDGLRKQKGINWPLFLFVGMFIIEIIISLVSLKLGSIPAWVKLYDKGIYTVLGIGGLVLVIMWLFTDHYTTKYNWNVLWLSPLYLGLIFRQHSKILNFGIAFLIGCTLFAALFQSFNIAIWPLIGVIIMKGVRNLTMRNRNVMMT